MSFQEETGTHRDTHGEEDCAKRKAEMAAKQLQAKAGQGSLGGTRGWRGQGWIPLGPSEVSIALLIP